eukprot:jgi/Mesen1/10105/ME000748S09284
MMPKPRGLAHRARSISLPELSAHFHLPINDVARKLGVCVTVLKQRCREHGISRWPYRKVRKLDSIISALQSSCQPEAPKPYCVKGTSDEERQKKLETIRETRDFLLRNPNSAAHLKLGKVKCNCLKRSDNVDGSCTTSSSSEGEASHCRGPSQHCCAGVAAAAPPPFASSLSPSADDHACRCGKEPLQQQPGQGWGASHLASSGGSVNSRCPEHGSDGPGGGGGCGHHHQGRSAADTGLSHACGHHHHHHKCEHKPQAQDLLRQLGGAADSGEKPAPPRTNVVQEALHARMCAQGVALTDSRPLLLAGKPLVDVLFRADALSHHSRPHARAYQPPTVCSPGAGAGASGGGEHVCMSPAPHTGDKYASSEEPAAACDVSPSVRFTSSERSAFRPLPRPPSANSPSSGDGAQRSPSSCPAAAAASDGGACQDVAGGYGGHPRSSEDWPSHQQSCQLSLDSNPRNVRQRADSPHPRKFFATNCPDAGMNGSASPKKAAGALLALFPPSQQQQHDDQHQCEQQQQQQQEHEQQHHEEQQPHKHHQREQQKQQQRWREQKQQQQHEHHQQEPPTPPTPSQHCPPHAPSDGTALADPSTPRDCRQDAQHWRPSDGAPVMPPLLPPAEMLNPSKAAAQCMPPAPAGPGPSASAAAAAALFNPYYPPMPGFGPSFPHSPSYPHSYQLPMMQQQAFAPAIPRPSSLPPSCGPMFPMFPMPGVLPPGWGPYAPGSGNIMYDPAAMAAAQHYWMSQPSPYNQQLLGQQPLAPPPPPLQAVELQKVPSDTPGSNTPLLFGKQLG